MAGVSVKSEANRVSGTNLSAGVSAFAAIVRTAAGEELFGKVAGDEALPKAQRRRMSAFDLGVARCLGGLAQNGVDEEIVFASRHGNMDLTTDILLQLANNEIVSPAKFSMSVHNAALGAASQMTANRAGHTAVAAGPRSMAAGLTEAWLRLSSGSPSILMLYADHPLVGPYAPFDEPGPGVHVAMRLVRGAGEAHALEDGRTGAEALARALAAGTGAVTWRP